MLNQQQLHHSTDQSDWILKDASSSQPHAQIVWTELACILPSHV